eukprot:GSChrysophyteH1.ASY1.ANO1.3334.1 assembled CDS
MIGSSSFSGSRTMATDPGGETLFERLENTDETLQLRQIIEALQNRVSDLERINLDLEHRLEDSAKQCMKVENDCVVVDQSWKIKTGELEKEISIWRQSFNSQKLKTDKLREHLSRTEKELYSILQRKYELMRGPGRSGGRSGQPGGVQMRDTGGKGLISSEPSRSGHSQDSSLGIGSNLQAPAATRHVPSTEESDSSQTFFPEDPHSLQEADAPQEIRQRRMMTSLTDFLNL